MKVNCIISIDKKFLKQLNLLNDNLSTLIQKESTDTKELSKTLDGFSKTIKTILDTTQIITGKVK